VKRLGIGLLVALAIGGAVGALVARDPGYVLVTYGNRSVETSLWVFVALWLIAYALVRSVAWLVRRIVRGPESLSEWNRARRERHALDRTSAGLLMMAEGRWEGARKELLASADAAHTPLVNLLAAARASHALGDSAKATELIERAGVLAGKDSLPVALSAAEIDIDAGRPQAAITRLRALPKDVAMRPAVLRLLARAYETSGDDAALRALLPDLRATKLVAEEELARLRLVAWTPPATDRASTTELERDWKALSKSERDDPRLVGGYARTLLARGEADQAEALLRGALSTSWNEDLADLYGEIRGTDSAQQLRVAEGWLRQRPHSAALLRSLGRIAVGRGESAKAREYFEASLRLERAPSTFRELARLCLASGETERAAEYLAQAVAPAGEPV
jgi:HemY protein